MIVATVMMIPIIVTLVGMVTDRKPVLIKELLLIIVTLVGMITEVSPEQPSKAL